MQKLQQLAAPKTAKIAKLLANSYSVSQAAAGTLGAFGTLATAAPMKLWLNSLSVRSRFSVHTTTTTQHQQYHKATKSNVATKIHNFTKNLSAKQINK